MATGGSYAMGAFDLVDSRSWVDRRNLDSVNDEFNSTLEKMGIKGTVLANLITPILILGIIIAFHLIMTPLKLFKPKPGSKGWRYWCPVIIETIWNFMTFSVYFRYTTLIFQYLLLASLSALYNYFNSVNDNLSNLLISIAVLVFCIGFTLFSYFMYYSAFREATTDKFKYTGEFFRGIRDSRIARLYTPLLLTRRLALVVWLISTISLSATTTVIGMVAMQLLGFISILIMCPFKLIINNIIETMNEVFVTFYFTWLMYFNVESRWNERVTYAYLTIIAANFLLILALSIIALVFVIQERCKNRKEAYKKPSISEHESENSPNRSPQSERDFNQFEPRTSSTGLGSSPSRKLTKMVRVRKK